MKNITKIAITTAILAVLLSITTVYTILLRKPTVSHPVTPQKILVKPTSTPTPTKAPQYTEQHIITLINEQRTIYGLPKVTEIAILDNSALLKAKDMNDHKYFSHTDSQGRYFTGFFLDAGWKGTEAENLAMGFDTDEQAITAWMNSPEHKANILQTNAIYVGYAQVGTYRVMHFGGYH